MLFIEGLEGLVNVVMFLFYPGRYFSLVLVYHKWGRPTSLQRIMYPVESAALVCEYIVIIILNPGM